MAINESSERGGLGRDDGAASSKAATGGSDKGPSTVAEQSRVLPIIYGTVKAQLNLVEMVGPQSGLYDQWQPNTNYYKYDRVRNKSPNEFSGLVYECVTSGVSAASGPGPFSEKKSGTIADGTVQWNFVQRMPMPSYKQNFVAAVCEGQAQGVLNVWWDRQLDDTHTAIYLGGGAWNGSQRIGRRLRFFVGRDALDQQMPYPFDSFSHQRTALVVGRDIDTGTQKELPGLAVEVEGVMFGSSVPDVSPADIVVDLLTHARRGLGLPSSIIGSSITGSGAATFRTYCDAAGLRLSMLIDTQQSALSLIAAILAATNSVACWSGGELKIRPLCDQSLTSPVYGAVNYVPDNTAAYDLGPDDFVDKGAPVQIARRSDADCYNSVPIEYTDRQAGYARVTVEDPEMTDVEIRGGLRRAPPVSLPVIFPDGKAAVLLSRTATQRDLFSRNEYRFRLSWRYSLLEPTDIVTLTEPGIGLSMVPVMITSLEEGDDETISFTAVDYPAGVSAAKTYTPQVGDGYVPNVEATTQVIPTLVDGVNVGLENVVLGPMVVSNWTERSNPKNVGLLGIAWSPALGRFAAVGRAETSADAYIVTSTDGNNWTERTSPKNYALRGIAWSPSLGLFAAVGDPDGTDAYIVTSPDGTNWTERSNPKNETLFGVAWSPELGLFAAVGELDGTDAYIVTSPDGITWTERSNPNNYTLHGIAWSPSLGLFAAVGAISAGSVDAYIVTSPDGITWTERSNPRFNSMNGIAWSPALGLFAAVGNNDGTDAYILTSSDGISWIERANEKAVDLISIAWSPALGLFASVGGAVGTETYIVTSDDGVSWSRRGNPRNTYLRGIDWSPLLGLFAAVGDADGVDAYIITDLAVPPSHAPNLATNPGFESGDTDWTKESTWTVVNDAANARSGSWCARTINPPHSGIYNGVYNGVLASRGDAFYAEAWIKSSAGATANAYIRISWKNSSGSDLGYSLGNAIGATTSYQKSSVTAAAPAGTAYIQIAVIIAVGGSTGTWYADDVLFKAL